MAAPTAADVPHKFDLVLSGGGLSAAVGFVQYAPWTGGASNNAPEKALLSHTSPFVQRVNTGNQYGDDATDFYYSWTQKSWDLGEQQKYQGRDEESKRRYWRGESVNVSVPGQVSMREDVRSLTFSENIYAFARNSQLVIAAGTTKLWSVPNTGTISDLAVHGLGAAPSRFGIATDEDNIFISTTTGGTVGVRKRRAGAYSTFSASGADALALLNNTLYGYRKTSSTGDLIRYDSAGSVTSLYTWKSGDGNIIETDTQILPYGGKLLILRYAAGNTADPAELWLYDGTAPALIQRFPAGFAAHRMEITVGVVYIAGFESAFIAGTSKFKPIIFYYANGAAGILWRGDSFYIPTAPQIALVGYADGLVFTDPITDRLMFYSPERGGVHAIGKLTVNVASVAATERFLVVIEDAGTGGFQYPKHDAIVASATIISALFDFDSSLNKIFRGITVEYDEDGDGDGGSIDIAYRVGDVDGAYTTLQTGAVSGTEYTLTNITGRSISVKITLIRGTSTDGPVLKRVSLRAVPVIPSRRLNVYMVDCTGVNGENITLNDGSHSVKDGLDLYNDLKTAATSTTPLTATDVTGTFTAQVAELQAIQIRGREGEFVCRLVLREI